VEFPFFKVLRFRPGNAFANRTKMSANGKVSEKPLVCVVDDDSLIRDSTVRLIRSFGFRVEAFASAEEFRNSGYLEETACLVLDVRMPDIDGLELQRRLSEAGERIPIVFITAYADDEQERRAMEAGAVGFLYKPFSQESLLQAVRSAVGEQKGET
jgi:FixJ family two-component response regulator